MTVETALSRLKEAVVAEEALYWRMHADPGVESLQSRWNSAKETRERAEAELREAILLEVRAKR